MTQAYQEYHNVMVAVDGSEQSEQAFEKALHVTKGHKAKLIIATVIDIRSFSADLNLVDLDVQREEQVQMKELLSKYQQKATEYGIEHVETDVQFGNPKVMLTEDLVMQHQVDLIICGQSGLNAVERILMGSVSSYIVSHAPCDVLVVRSDEK